MPIIGKCLEGITKAGTNVNERNVSRRPRRKINLNAALLFIVCASADRCYHLIALNAGHHGCDRAEQVGL